MASGEPDYLLRNDDDELARIQLQARTWEPAGAALLEHLGGGAGGRVIDVGCGAMGWLRVLSRWVGPSGQVVGTDLDDGMLARARAFAAQEELANVRVERDDLFASALPAHTFDLVHARFQLAPLGRFEAQVAAFARLARPGGWLVLEEPDAASWRAHPDAPACAALVALVREGFASAGGDFDVGRRLPSLLRRWVDALELRTHVLPLRAGHPYARLPLQFASSLRPRLLARTDAATLDALLAEAAAELADPERWSTTFTLVQAWGQVRGDAPTV